MAKKAATKGDQVKSEPSVDIHMDASSNTAFNCTFTATIDKQVSSNVFINGKAAALKGSVASEAVTHDPAVQSSYSPTPASDGPVGSGSATVLMNGTGAAREGDTAQCCTATGKVVIQGTRTVFIGG